MMNLLSISFVLYKIIITFLPQRLSAINTKGSVNVRAFKINMFGLHCVNNIMARVKRENGYNYGKEYF